MKRSKVLISAYYCKPGMGSEEGVGWNMTWEMARYHEVWVITRASNRPSIEAGMALESMPTLRFVYYDLPSWARWWARGQLLEWHLYYYLWQICIYFVARRLHRRVSFDVVHHVTFVKYWIPSFLVNLPVPFIWGPVGGGESAPKVFWRDFGLRGKAQEVLRNFGRWLGEHDPFVRLVSRRSTLTWATTEETAARMRRLGAKDVRLSLGVGLPEQDVRTLGNDLISDGAPVRFISVGRLVHVKGFHLGLQAFAKASLPATEYWIVGDGPERRRLEALAEWLNVEDRVRFWGHLPRKETLAKLQECHVLVHPSLHDSGGIACLEAMAAGRPVVCLDLGGPAALLTKETGCKVTASDPDAAVRDLADAISLLARDSELRVRMGEAGRKRVREAYSWDAKGRLWARLYEEILDRE
jgi:glycosyltransferase involved in cell wall biosynthesis